VGLRWRWQVSLHGRPGYSRLSMGAGSVVPYPVAMPPIAHFRPAQ
jgi:hypothetical protein